MFKKMICRANKSSEKREKVNADVKKRGEVGVESTRYKQMWPADKIKL
jgi:hypothetical protein